MRIFVFLWMQLQVDVALNYDKKDKFVFETERTNYVSEIIENIRLNKGNEDTFNGQLQYLISFWQKI